MVCDRSDQGVGSLGDVPPGRAKGLDIAVVAREPVDPALNANKSELGVSVRAVLLQVLPDADGFLNQVVEVLWEIGGHAGLLQDS